MSQGKAIDYLDEDTPISGQSWVCISFLSPEGIKNCNIRGVKIRGVYSTKKQADKRVKELQITDPDFDIFVGEVGKWLPWNPDPNDAEDQVYQETQLNDLMKGYKENLVNAKKVQEERKRSMLEEGAKEEESKLVARKEQATNGPATSGVKSNNIGSITTGTSGKNEKPNKTRDRLRRKLDKRNAKNRINAVQGGTNVEPYAMIPDTTTTPTDGDKKEEVVVEASMDDVKQLQSNASSVSEKLDKLRELYAKLN